MGHVCRFRFVGEESEIDTRSYRSRTALACVVRGRTYLLTKVDVYEYTIVSGFMVVFKEYVQRAGEISHSARQQVKQTIA